MQYRKKLNRASCAIVNSVIFIEKMAEESNSIIGFEVMLALAAVCVIAFVYFTMQSYWKQESSYIARAAKIASYTVVFCLVCAVIYYVYKRYKQRTAGSETPPPRRPPDTRKRGPPIKRKSMGLMVSSGTKYGGDVQVEHKRKVRKASRGEGGGAGKYGRPKVDLNSMMTVADKGLHVLMMGLGVLYGATSFSSQSSVSAGGDPEVYAERLNQYRRLWKLLSGLHLRLFFVRQGSKYAASRAAASGGLSNFVPRT